MDDPPVFRWLLDVNHLWSSPAIAGSKGQSTADWANGHDARKALDLLSSDEQAKVLRFYHIRDAKLCLGSSLLKRSAITKTCQVSWREIVVGEDHNRKPCFKPITPTDTPIEFNVSHHGTLVALVGCAGRLRKLGVDIVQVNFERDAPAVKKDGLRAWLQVYEVVFSDREIADMDEQPPSDGSDMDRWILAKLRNFYAHWCLKEAYLKMVGEALLASWLKDLEFLNVQVPSPVSYAEQGATNNAWGQICTNNEIWLKGKRLTDVKMELQAYGTDYMIATAVSESSASLSSFTVLDVMHDVYP